MQSLNFNPGIGKIVFDDYSHAEASLNHFIEQHNPGIKSLDLQMRFGEVVLKGMAKTADALEKLVLLIGNIKGIRKVDSSQVEAPIQLKEVEFYEVQEGDTLIDISQRYLGNGGRYIEVFKDNEEILGCPSLIYPGQTIRIVLG